MIVVVLDESADGFGASSQSFCCRQAPAEHRRRRLLSAVRLTKLLVH